MIFSLLDTPAYGGAEEYLLTVLSHLQKNGEHIVLATNNAQVKEKCDSSITVIHLPYRLDAIGNWKGLVKYFLALPGSIVWLIQTIHAFKSPVICLFPGYTDRLSFSPVVKWLGCTLIWLEYGPLEPTFSRNHGFPRLLYAIGRTFPDKIVTISEWTKRSLVNVGKIQEGRIQIIYPGVETNEGQREKVKGKRFTVVTVARLAKEKEIDLLLKAWSMARVENAQLVVVGDGPERSYLESLARNLGVQRSVKFVGFVPTAEKMRLLANADLFVFPSAWELEGFGMTTIEAMAAGVPVITTGYGPQAEIITNGKNGWFFTPHSADDLASKIIAAHTRTDLKKIGDNCRRLASERFSIPNMLLSWTQAISLD